MSNECDDNNTHNWLRIESIAIGALFLFIFLVGPYKRWQINPVVRFLYKAATVAAGSLFTQVLGMLTSYKYDATRQIYLSWFVFLGVASDITVASTAYSIYEQSNERVAFEINALTNSVYVAVLMGLTSFDNFLIPLWVLWGFTILKMFLRVLLFRKAARTYGPENVDLVAHFSSELDSKDKSTCADGKGYYEYWVRGEEKVTYKYGESTSTLKAINHVEKIVKIRDVWQCKGKLFKDEETRPAATRLKDVCLSFALFKLLRRRFRDYPAEDEDQRLTARKLVLEELLAPKKNHRDDEDQTKGLQRRCRRTFHVVQVELEFLHDLFYTKYPMSFYSNSSLTNILQLLVIPSSVWGLWTASCALKSVNDTYDLVLTYIFTVLVIVMELWEFSNHMLSNWSKVLKTCIYVRHNERYDKFHIDKLMAILGLCGTLWKPLNRKLGQYSLFGSYKSHSIYSNLYKVFTYFMGETEVGLGGRKSPPVKVAGDVQYAIFLSLRKELRCIGNGERLLRRNELWHNVDGNVSKLACKQKDFGREIMVWHIATSYFDLEMGNNREKKMKKVGAEYNYSEVAIRLSRYCAYLLLFAPDLLPVNNLVTKLMFEEIIADLQALFAGVSWCDKLMGKEKKKMYEEMKRLVRQTKNGGGNKETTEEKKESIRAEGLSPAKDLVDITEKQQKEEEDPTKRKCFDNDANLLCGKLMFRQNKKTTEKKEESILTEGLNLAKHLVDVTEMEDAESAQEKRWKVLAEFWAEFLLFLAPSDSNAMAHLEMLSNGGEFITHLWALLYNAGIVSREGTGSSAV